MALIFSQLVQLKGPTPPPPSDNPKESINLFETVLFTHQPILDDIQQLIRVFFTTEERERIIQEARKNAPSDMSAPSIDQAAIDSGFPLTIPDWDFNMAEGKGYLKVYHQTLLAGIKEAIV